MMDKKGITPVVAMIMLLLIVVSLAGGFLIWMNRTWKGLQKSGTEAVEQSTETMNIQFSVDNVNGADVSIRNSGSKNINKTSLAFYLNGDSRDCSFSDNTYITPDEIETCTLSSGSCGSGDSVKVTGPGGKEDSWGC